MSTTTTRTTRRSTTRPTPPAQTIAAIMIPHTPPDFCEALEQTELFALFEQIRDDVRGCPYDTWLTQLLALEQQMQQRLPEPDRDLVSRVGDLRNEEEQTSMEAAFLVGVEVGKRMAGR